VKEETSLLPTLSPDIELERMPMNISIAHLQPIVSLIAGVLILMMPRLLNYIVAFFLIVSGILGLGLIH
jgi:uncharacterized membrane protein YdbT with pleckstrin-like domain